MASHVHPARQYRRSVKAIQKQRMALMDWTRPPGEIRKPYRMRTREFERRVRILERHEKLLSESLSKLLPYV